MSGTVVIYGATGYTGRELARYLAEDIPLVLAGRNAEKLRAVAEPLGLRWQAVSLDDPAGMRALLAQADVVLNASGPYADTALPVLEACLGTGTHYLDLTGEYPVFAALMECDQVARDAGIMVLPGIGLTIAASDCLLKRAVELWPDTVKLCLGVSQAHSVTRGSATTAARLFSKDVVLRRNGQIAHVPVGKLTRAFDFGEGLRETTAMSWGDVVTGEHSTGVANIEVYSELPWWQRAGFRASGLWASLTGSRPWRGAGTLAAKAWPQDAPATVREEGGYVMVVEALDPWRRVRRLRLQTLDGYGTSILTAADGIRRVLEGDWSAGFQTPSTAFGSDFIEEARAGAFEPHSTGAAA